jgi:hypothetical protein
VDAIGQLEEVGDSEGAADIKVEAISERSGVSLDKVKILLRRLSVDESDWVAATWGSVRDPLDPCWIRGLGPKGLENVQGFRGRRRSSMPRAAG